MNVTDPSPPRTASSLVRLSIAAMYSLLIVVGLGGHAVVILGFIRDRKEYSKLRFYNLIYTLTAGDVGVLLVQLATIPIVITGRQLYDGPYLGVGHLLCFVVVFYASFLIAVNRFAVFIFKANNPVVTDVFGDYMWFTCMIPLVRAAFGLVFFGGIAVCWLLFSPDGFYWTHRCFSPISQVVMNFMVIIYMEEFVVPLLMLILYVWVFLTIRFGKQWRSQQLSTDKNTRERANRELRFLFQGAVICLVLEVHSVLFIAHNLFAYSGDGLFAGVAAHVFTILNSSINPYIFLYFNSAVRASVRGVLGITGEDVATTAQSAKGAASNRQR